MPWTDAFNLPEKVARERVLRHIWGHQAPEERRIYTGTFLWVFGEYGDLLPIAIRFAGLPDSPWLFDDVLEEIGKQSDRLPRGGVYRFTGTYRKLKNGGAVWKGRHRLVVKEPDEES